MKKSASKLVKKRSDRPKEDVVKKVYKYDTSNELPIYGVIVQWDAKIKYTNKALADKFESKLAIFRSLLDETNKSTMAVKSLKRKPIPYLRRIGPSKAVVMFGNMVSANDFVDMQEEDDEFTTFIPMSFVSTVGVARFSKFNFKLTDLQEFFPKGYTVLQWRKKRLPDGKIQVSIAVQGSKIPESLIVKGETVPFELFERKPIYCIRCLRYGHRTNDCMRKPRCGVCLPRKPYSKHRENQCGTIRHNPDIERCLYCGQGHSIGTEGCIEHGQQREFKMKLVRHKMDYLSVLERDTLPAIRTTPVNSNRIWMD